MNGGLLHEILADVQKSGVQAVIDEHAPALPQRATYLSAVRGAAAALVYVERHLPELRSGGKVFVDVGPGVGWVMTVAAKMENIAIGEELPRESPTVIAYGAITDALGLTVRGNGFHRYSGNIPTPWPYEPASVDVFHFRGSIDSVLQPLGRYNEKWTLHLMRLMAAALRPGGFIHLSHNLSGDLDEFKAIILSAGMLAGLEVDGDVTRMVKP